MHQNTQKLKIKKLQDYLDSSNYFYQELLGYKPEKTNLQLIPENKWKEFAQTIGANQNSSGSYLSRNQTAIIMGKNPLSLFHEYFGHGLYCEQSLTGRKLVDLEKKLLEEEKQEFKEKQFTLEHLEKFRKNSLIFEELDNFRKNNLAQYELFAIFTEYLLSKEFSINEMFEKKYDSLEREDREVIDSTINFNNQSGNLATFYSSGLARRTTPKRVKRLLEDIYKDKLSDVKFALLYGSRKVFSDIDVFMIGKNPKESHSNFLDVKMQSPKDLQKGIKNFDVRTLIPLMNGELLFGDKFYFEKARNKVLTQLITEEAIKYNLKWSVRMRRLRNENLEDDFLRTKFGGYSQTYLSNALALKEGRRLFTKEKLLNSQSENFIELKGGIIK